MPSITTTQTPGQSPASPGGPAAHAPGGNTAPATRFADLLACVQPEDPPETDSVAEPAAAGQTAQATPLAEPTTIQSTLATVLKLPQGHPPPDIVALPPAAAGPSSAGSRSADKRPAPARGGGAEPVAAASPAVPTDAPVSPPVTTPAAADPVAAAPLDGPLATATAPPGQPSRHDTRAPAADTSGLVVAIPHADTSAPLASLDATDTPAAAVAPAIVMDALTAAPKQSVADRPASIGLNAVTTPVAAGDGDAAAIGGWQLRPGGAQHLRVDLSGDALGTVRIEIGAERNGAATVLRVDKPELLAALVDNRDQLGQALDTAGVAGGHHTISFVAAEARDAGGATSGQPGPGQHGGSGQGSSGQGASGSGAASYGATGDGTGAPGQHGGGGQSAAATRATAGSYAGLLEGLLSADARAALSCLSTDGIDITV